MPNNGLVRRGGDRAAAQQRPTVPAVLAGGRGVGSGLWATRRRQLSVLAGRRECWPRCWPTGPGRRRVLVIASPNSGPRATQRASRCGCWADNRTWSCAVPGAGSGTAMVVVAVRRGGAGRRSPGCPAAARRHHADRGRQQRPTAANSALACTVGRVRTPAAGGAVCWLLAVRRTDLRQQDEPVGGVGGRCWVGVRGWGFSCRGQR